MVYSKLICGVIEDAIISKFTGDRITDLYSKTSILREDTAKIAEQVEKLSLEAFYHNVRENDKVILLNPNSKNNFGQFTKLGTQFLAQLRILPIS